MFPCKVNTTAQRTMKSYVEPYGALHVFRLALTCCIFLLTFIGNSLAIYFIYKSRHLRSIRSYYYGYYLINLNVADLLVAIFCIPFTVVYYESDHWPFGSIFCKMMPTLHIMSVSASIITLCVITFQRHRAVVHPMQSRSTFTQLKIKIILIWMWAVIVSSPSAFAYDLDITRPSLQCREEWSTHNHRKAYTVVLFLLNYAFPLIFDFLNYLIIVLKLKARTGSYEPETSRILQKRFFRLMVMLLTSFALCYLPGYICFFLLDFGQQTIQNDKFFTLINFSHIFTWINSCLNPYFYCALHGFLKRERQRSSEGSSEEFQRRTSAYSSLISADSFHRFYLKKIGTVPNQVSAYLQGQNTVNFTYEGRTETLV